MRFDETLRYLLHSVLQLALNRCIHFSLRLFSHLLLFIFTHMFMVLCGFLEKHFVVSHSSKVIELLQLDLLDYPIIWVLFLSLLQIIFLLSQHLILALFDDIL